MRGIPGTVLLAGALLPQEEKIGPGGCLMLRLVGGLRWSRKEVRKVCWKGGLRPATPEVTPSLRPRPGQGLDSSEPQFPHLPCEDHDSPSWAVGKMNGDPAARGPGTEQG